MLENNKIVINHQQQEQQLADIQKQIEEQLLWTEYLPDVIQQIRQSLRTEDILRTSVREVRRILNCDRVVIYSLDQNNYGTIVAESVAHGWTRAEGRVIKDPCFEAKYLDNYRDGKVRAWSNIYEAGMSKCYIEQLEKLEVKANLVVPIINKGKVKSLLVAHQCADTRQWLQSEIRWIAQIAVQVSFALENAQLLADAQQLLQQAEEERMWTECVTDVIQHIRQSLQTKDILRTSVREVRRLLNCDRAVIYSLDQNNYGTIVAESVAHGWTRAEGRVIKDPCFETKYLDNYRDGRVRAWNNIYEKGIKGCYIEQLEKLEVKANLVVPIINKGKVKSLLVAHQCSDTRQWLQSEIRWMAQIGMHVGFALENANLLEQIEQLTENTREILARAVNSSSNIQRTAQDVGVVFNNLSNSCHKLSETINMLKLLSKHIAQQSMVLIRSLNLNRVDEGNQKPIIELSNRIFALIQKLFETTAKIEPLFTNIKTEIREKKNSLESETQRLIDGVEEFQTASQKLEQIVALNREMSNFIENFSNALETQIQNSNFAKDSVREVEAIAERISEQSISTTQFFDRLMILVKSDVN